MSVIKIAGMIIFMTDLNVYSSKKFADISSLKENVEWVIDSVPCVRHEVIYGCCPEPFPDVAYYVHLRRKPGSYVMNIIMPAMATNLCIIRKLEDIYGTKSFYQ
jgi:hypothetical protein